MHVYLRRARRHAASDAATATGLAALAVLLSPLPAAGVLRAAAAALFVRAAALCAASCSNRSERAAAAAAVAASAAWLWSARSEGGKGAARVTTPPGPATRPSPPDGRAHVLAVLLCTACLVARSEWLRRRRGAGGSTAGTVPPPPPPRHRPAPPPPQPARGDGLGTLRVALLNAPHPRGDEGDAAEGGAGDAEREEAHACLSLASFLRASPLLQGVCGVWAATAPSPEGGGCATEARWGDARAAWLPAAPRGGGGGEEEVSSAAWEDGAQEVRGGVRAVREGRGARVVALSARLVHGAASSHVGTVSLLFLAADAPPPARCEALLLGAARCAGEHVAHLRAARAAAGAAVRLDAALAVVGDIYPAGVAARLTGRASASRLSLGRLSLGRASNCSRLSASTACEPCELGGGGGGGLGDGFAPARRAQPPARRRASMSSLVAGATAAAAVRRQSAGAAATAEAAVEEAAAGGGLTGASFPRTRRALRPSFSRSASLDGRPGVPPPRPPRRRSHSPAPAPGRPSVAARRALAARAGALDTVWQAAAASLPPPRRDSQAATPTAAHAQPRPPPPHLQPPPPAAPADGGTPRHVAAVVDGALYVWIGAHPFRGGGGGGRGSVSLSARLSAFSDNSTRHGRLAGEAARREGSFQWRGGGGGGGGCGAQPPPAARAPDARAAASLPVRASAAEDDLFVEHHPSVSIVFADVRAPPASRGRSVCSRRRVVHSSPPPAPGGWVYHAVRFLPPRGSDEDAARPLLPLG